MAARAVQCAVLISLFSAEVLGSSSDPQPIFGSAGGSVLLRCNKTLNAPVDWRYQRQPTEFNPYIVIGGRLLDEFKSRMELDPVDFTLTMHNLTLNDSGLYSCIEDSGIGVVHLVQLTVGLTSSLEWTTNAGPEPRDGNNVAAIVAPAVLVPIVLSVIVGVTMVIVRRGTVNNRLQGATTDDRLESLGMSNVHPKRQHKGRDSATELTKLSETVKPIKHVIKRLAKELHEFVEPDYGLMDQLLSLGLLTHQEYIEIPAEPTVYSRLDRLLALVLSNDDLECQKFVSALENTDQQHVVNYINRQGENEVGDVRPLEDIQLVTLNTNTPRLIELIKLADNFLANLAHRGSILERQRSRLLSISDPFQKNTKLLEILRRRSIGHYNEFAACLEEDGQHGLLRVFQGTGVVVRLDATLDQSYVDDVIETENKIETRFRVIMAQLKSNLSQSDLETRDKLMLMLEKELGMGIQLIDMRKQNSIDSYFHCRTHKSLQKLDDVYRNGCLVGLMESIFTLLGHNVDNTIHTKLQDSGTKIGIQTLLWNNDDYESCQQYFSNVTEIAKIQDHLMMILPVEMIELILIRAFCRLFFRQLKALQPESVAEQRSYLALAGVCYDWWQTIHGWQQSDTKHWVKHKLQRILGRVCLPYGCRSKLTTTLTTASLVQGVTHLNDNIFVICNKSDTIKVFGQNYERLADIEVKVWKNPRDLVACTETRSLYVTDYGERNPSGFIWRISLQGQVNKFLPAGPSSTFRPLSISATSGRLLVTASDRLLLYGAEDGVQLKKLLLPGMSAKHAVETSRGTVVVCHKKPQPQIIEADIDGHVLSVYNDQQQLGRPWHLALDSEGRVLLADRYKHNVLLLTSNLELERVLLDKAQLGFEPFRLCYAHNGGRLLVGSDYGGVRVFRLR